MLNISLNSRELIIESWHEKKANRSGFDILSPFKQKLWIKQACRQKIIKHTKIQLNSINSFVKVIPLDRTFHQDSNKI
jgi:hypothetical protein